MVCFGDGVLPVPNSFTEVLGWPQSSFVVFCNILQENPNELFGQPNIFKGCLVFLMYLTSPLLMAMEVISSLLLL